MSYNYQTFLRPIYPNSKNIQILNDSEELIYTIVPDSISNIRVSNNLLKITLKSDKVIFLDFNTNSFAELAKNKLDNQISILSGNSTTDDIFDYNDFLIPINQNSVNIQIKNIEGIIVYTINPNSIRDVKINNKKLEIITNSSSIISILFNSESEAISAKMNLKSQISELKNTSEIEISSATHSEFIKSFNFNYQNFLRPLMPGIRNIQIIDISGNIKYTVNPFFVINTLVINNLVKINLKNDKVIILDFMNSTQAKSALFEIQTQIESLISKTPFLIEKNIENYIESKILEIQFPKTNFYNGLVFDSGTVSLGGTVSDTIYLNSQSTDLIGVGFDSINFTSSTFDILSDFVSIDSTENIQILADKDISILSGDRLNLIGESVLVSIGSSQGIIYSEDYSDGFIDRSLVDKSYVDNLLLGITNSNDGDPIRFISGATAFSFDSPTISVSGNLMPSQNYTYDLGSTESRWDKLFVKDIFAASQSLYLGDLKLSSSDGQLSIQDMSNGGNITGIVGLTGSQGATGPQGDQGPQGFQGDQGPIGTQGFQGDQGATGPQGIQGDQGPIGPQGVQGDQGATGPQGVQGDQGPIGPQGFQGVQGATGPQGIQGNQGATGPQGVQGDQGPIGPQGFQGVQGATGPQGIQGNQGPIGPQGFQGVQGATGPQGIQGNQGPIGPQGTDGKSISYYKYIALVSSQSVPPNSSQIIWNNATQISSSVLYISHLTRDSIDIDVFLNLIKNNDNLIIQDESNSNNYQKWTVSGTPSIIPNNYVSIPVTYVTGGFTFSDGQDIILVPLSIGLEGPQGFQGNQGYQGPTGTQGTQGYQGPIGPQGLQGNQGFQGGNGPQGFQGNQGYQGPIGPQGFQGNQGYQGHTGTQGFQGYQGPTGPQGFQGHQGHQGPTGSQGQPGNSTTILNYKANSQINSGNPGSGFLIWNEISQIDSETIIISHKDVNLIDFDVVLSTLKVNDIFFIQNKINHLDNQNWKITGTPSTSPNLYWQFPVNLISATGLGFSNFSDNQDLIVGLIIQGVIGEQGFQGPTGPQGIQGNQGQQGLQGGTGPQGSQGPTGSQGNQGLQGPTGSSLSASNIIIYSLIYG